MIQLIFLIFLICDFYYWLAPHGFCVPHLCIHYKKKIDTRRGYTSKRFVFLTSVLKIVDPLSSVKLQHCNFIYLLFFNYSYKGMFKFLIETKKWKLLQICIHECNDPSRPLSPNLQKLLKNCDCLNQLSIKEIKKRSTWGSPIN